MGDSDKKLEAPNEIKKYSAEREKELLREIPKALLCWYNFRYDSKILYIGKEDSYAEVLQGYTNQIIYATCTQVLEKDWQKQFKEYFDYVACIEMIEQEVCPTEIFALIRKILKPDGILLLGMNNRLGLRYFCGDRDVYTGRNFDGIENYRRAYVKKEDVFCGRMYAKEELQKMLLAAGWKKEETQFFSVLTDLHNPSFIYADKYMPEEDLSNRVFPTYIHPSTVFLDEESLYQSLIDNKMFHQMANAYLIECSMNGALSDVLHVTSSIERGRENAFLTVIHKSGIVDKIAMYPEGRNRLERLIENLSDLKAHGLSVVEAKLINGVCRMPYVKAETGQIYLKRLLQNNQKKFFEEMDHFRDLILQSSDIVEPDAGDGKGALLRKGYLDLVPLNSFYVNGEFIFYDQEFSADYYPANVLIMRMIATLYAGNAHLHDIFPAEKLYERYHLTQYKERWQKAEWEFLGKLLNQEDLRLYHERCWKNSETVNANRQRMNYSEAEYQRLFVDVFKGIEGRKLVLFGSGIFAKQFIGMFGKDYPVYSIVDNNREKWGQDLQGITIESPNMLREFAIGEVKVIICIKNFLSVMKQLEEMGVKDYSIFDAGKSYPRRQPIMISPSDDKETVQKKYQVGYVAGVFDMFHVGHVNLLRRAKEQCQYLIVGVVSDEGVYCQKKRKPIISCEDRVEVLRSCRYVDQVEVLPIDYMTIRDAYKMFHFDCMFSGDDHGEELGWLTDKEFLQNAGVTIEFFQYTEKVSSTKLREQLQGRD